jgi:UDP-glucose 4-epimerase
VPLSIEDPKSTFDVNLLGTLNLLNLCAKAKIKRFVFISSCAVLGDTKSLPVTEEAPTNPISPYADSKLLAERYCLGYGERDLLEAVVLRFFNVYGPRQMMNDYSGVITLFIERCRRGLPFTVYGDGSQTRDFVNVKDVAEAVVASMKKVEAKGKIFNVGSGKPTSIETLAKTVLDLAGKNLEIKYEKARLGDIKDSYADISKAKKHLGYQPKVSLSDGLKTLMKDKGL